MATLVRRAVLGLGGSYAAAIGYVRSTKDTVGEGDECAAWQWSGFRVVLHGSPPSGLSLDGDCAVMLCPASLSSQCCAIESS